MPRHLPPGGSCSSGGGGGGSKDAARAGTPQPQPPWTSLLTLPLALACAQAAFSGILFGWDVGIVGGVVTNGAFLRSFFPAVLSAAGAQQSAYCEYNSTTLQLFGALMFAAAVPGALAGGVLSERQGRRAALLVGGLMYVVGSLLSCTAFHLPQLFVGRAFLGLGVGMTAQAASVFLSEVAPARLRGGLNICWQEMLSVGVLVAGMVNYGARALRGDSSWRLGLGLPAALGAAMALGAAFLPDTPNSLAKRGGPGSEAEVERVLRLYRGAAYSEEELLEILQEADACRAAGSPWACLRSPAPASALALALILSVFQQLTGLVAVIFYAPALMLSLGVPAPMASLAVPLCVGLAQVLPVPVAAWGADKQGRRFWFLLSGAQMAACHFVIAGVLATRMPPGGGGGALSPAAAGAVLAAIVVFIVGFSWGWGPIFWLYGGEVQPLSTRAVGYAIALAVNFVVQALNSQFFLSELCALQWRVFALFGSFTAAGTLFVYFFAPETRGVNIEQLQRLMASHWFWGKWVKAN